MWCERWKTVAMASATVIAHRGAREAARENTLPAFRLAREFGAEWVELDARRTADGVVVVPMMPSLPMAGCLQN